MTCEGAVMVRKRKKREDEQPPWCYYCDRVFSDEPTLVQHQKAKHFKVHIWQPPAFQKHIHAILRAVLYVIWQHMQDPRMQALIKGDAVQCTTCHKRLTSAGGLRVHCHQVHRFALEKCVLHHTSISTPHVPAGNSISSWHSQWPCKAVHLVYTGSLTALKLSM